MYTDTISQNHTASGNIVWEGYFSLTNLPFSAFGCFIHVVNASFYKKKNIKENASLEIFLGFFNSLNLCVFFRI